jgi:hypothetical protein
MSPGILVTLGYGGLIYEMLYNGHIMALQVVASIPANVVVRTNSTAAPG